MKTISAYLVIFISLLINGCSLIGFGIGTQLDNSKRHESIPSFYSISQLDEGADIDVTLFDEHTISGKYIGLDSLRTLNLKVNNRVQKIVLSDIKLIKQSPTYSGRIIGSTIGLAADFIALAIIASNMDFSFK